LDLSRDATAETSELCADLDVVVDAQRRDVGGRQLLGKVDLAGLDAAMALPNPDHRAAVDCQLDVMTFTPDVTLNVPSGRRC